MPAEIPTIQTLPPGQKRIVVVGEYLTEHEWRKGELFTGPQASIIKGHLNAAGIAPEEVHYTCVIMQHPSSKSIRSFCTTNKSAGVENYNFILTRNYLRAEFQPELDRLFEEIERVRPHLIIALGVVPLWALTKKNSIERHRGSPMQSYCGRYKVLPTWGPQSVIRQWNLNPVMFSDFHKAKKEMEFPELRRPERLLYLSPTLPDLYDFREECLNGQPFLGCDIETKAGTITEIGFSNALGTVATVVPFWSRQDPTGNYWPDKESEAAAWRWVREICSTFPLVGQNFQYDMQYLWRTFGIRCNFFGDTMIQHHSLYPELKKSLGFLASIYTDEPNWKFMRTDHDQLKQDDA